MFFHLLWCGTSFPVCYTGQGHRFVCSLFTGYYFNPPLLPMMTDCFLGILNVRFDVFDREGHGLGVKIVCLTLMTPPLNGFESAKSFLIFFD